MITNMLEGKPLPVYGDGRNVRDWLYVQDHAAAIWSILESGRLLEKYNIGGGNERTNLEIVNLICEYLEEILPATSNPAMQNLGLTRYELLKTFVKDRPGHDRRYAIDASKIKNELGWQPSYTFESGIRETINWYRANNEWVGHVTSGEYQKYYAEQYGEKA